MTAAITIANQKGSVSKTTTARHLVYFLEKRELVIDNDHQGNLTQYFGYDPIQINQTPGTEFHVNTGEKPLRDVIIECGPYVKLAPSSISPAEAGARWPKTREVG